jgi:hypothetical protein
MSLYQVYNKANIDTANWTSLLGIGNGFYITLHENDFYTFNSDYWRIPTIKKFNGIMLENLSLNFQTDWNDAGGAVLGKKIESFVNSKFVKMLAGQAGGGFQPFICSDAWTQQKMSGDAKPVIVQLKFKAYNRDRLGCTNYNDVILFLTHICSPVKSSSADNRPVTHRGENLGSDVKGTLERAVEGGANIIGTVVDAGKTFAAGFSNRDNPNDKPGEKEMRKQSFADAAKNLVETLDSSYNKLVAKTGSGKNNGNFTVKFHLSDKINQRNVYVNYKDTSANFVSDDFEIDWIVKSFSFTPSRQFQMVQEQGVKVPKPLWINFDLTLETRLSLSNRYIYNILNRNEVVMQDTVISP